MLDPDPDPGGETHTVGTELCRSEKTLSFILQNHKYMYTVGTILYVTESEIEL